jgi:hypothetical protein
MTNTLRVRNIAQKVLLEDELLGQMSDGRWENSNPMDHWKPWCNATIVVDPENVGRDFYPRRDGYCFTEKDLLEIIGERMLEAVRTATGNPDYTHKNMLADLRDLRKIFKTRAIDIPVPPQPASWVKETEHSYTHGGKQYSYTTTLTMYTPQPAVSPDPTPERSFTMADFDPNFTA